jgi:hypothetical protein
MKSLSRCLAVLTCGILALPAVSETDRASILSLRSGTVDVREPEPAMAADLKAAAAENGSEEYLLVKFPGPVSAAQIRELEQRSERIYTYLPHDAFLVRMRAGEQDKIGDPSLGASWAGVYHPAYKLAPAVSTIESSGPIKADEAPQIVMVHVFPDADLDALLDEVERLAPGKVVGSGKAGRFARLRLLLGRDEVAALRGPLARRKDVFWIDVEPRRVLLNDTTVWVAQSGTAGGQQTPIHDQGIFGEGQIVGILDTGIDPDMCYFRDPSLGLPPVNACNGGTVVNNNQRKVIAVDFLWSSECAGGISSSEWDTHDHGTHVAGTVAGDNFANLLGHDPGDGLAPGAKLVIQDCGFQTNNCADCPGIGCPVVDLNPVFQQPYDQGARIHTNSWGDDENNPNGGQYSSGSQDADEFMWNHKDFLLLFAAGNSGPGSNTVLSPATAKNVVSVGATLRGSSAESLASFSSCGPTDDGRIKPDVTMPGSGIISANNDVNTGSNNCGTRSMSGTSMASPGVAGAAALVRQYYTGGWYPSGSENPPDGFTPSAALVKATLINSGHDMSGVAAIPSNCQGWGRVKLDDSLAFSGQTLSLAVDDDTTGFAQGSSGEDRTSVYTVAAGTPLKVTLTWTDFPSTPAASPNIVNDLDLIVSGPGGTFLGNVFSGGQSTTGGTADRRNTVEQVLLANPPAGAYTVTVRSFTVPVGPQPFALVVTGDLAGQCTVDGDCDDGLFCNGEETCDTGSGACQAGTPPCSGGETCVESSDTCSVCLHDVDFEAGAGGWIQGAGSCSTGGFVVGVPDATDFQVAGGNPGNAFFTAPNPGGVGTDDVDGGTCEALSPIVDASAAAEVEITVDWFHGQRDPGDDAGDGFSIEVLNDGLVVDTLVAIGDVTHAAAWATASTTVTDPGDVRLRVRASDAAATGDIVEGGVDNVRICPTGPPPACQGDGDCDDGLFCNGAETCNLGTGACEAGTAPDCGDGVGCTNDSCNEATDGCDNVPDDGLCANGLFCDGDEVCSPAAGCQDGPDPCSGGQTCNEAGDVCEGGGACSHGADFESGAGGWTRGADSCSTGGFVVGVPDATAWQVGGGNPGQAFFTAANPGGVGTDDVDGGTCEALSPAVDCAGQEAAEVTVDWFHGQRDPGDDSGDFFTIEVLNDGIVVDTLVAIGDVTSAAAWSTASTVIADPGDVRVRVRAADGPAGGDIVEAGVDNVSIAAAAAPVPCSVEEDFEGGAGGWTNSGASTCATGAFVAATPTAVVNGGVTTQVGGDHTSGAGNAFFSAVNTAAGTHDVDGGTCVVTSPVYAVGEASEVSVWYFHGQRDAGGDDFFLLEISTDGGSNFTPLVSIGAVTVNAVWTEATATVPAGSSVRFRVQAADGPASGDLVEAGVDDVRICPSN